MDNQPPKNNEQNYPNIQNSTDQKSQNPNTTNDNPKESTTNRKENNQQKHQYNNPLLH